MRKTWARYGKTNYQEVPDSDQEDRRPNERVTNDLGRKFRRGLTPPIRVWICSSSGRRHGTSPSDCPVSQILYFAFPKGKIKGITFERGRRNKRWPSTAIVTVQILFWACRSQSVRILPSFAFLPPYYEIIRDLATLILFIVVSKIISILREIFLFYAVNQSHRRHVYSIIFFLID